MLRAMLAVTHPGGIVMSRPGILPGDEEVNENGPRESTFWGVITRTGDATRLAGRDSSSLLIDRGLIFFATHIPPRNRLFVHQIFEIAHPSPLPVCTESDWPSVRTMTSATLRPIATN